MQADSLPSEPPGKPNKQNKQNHVEFELLWGDIEEKQLKKKRKNREKETRKRLKSPKTKYGADGPCGQSTVTN